MPPPPPLVLPSAQAAAEREQRERGAYAAHFGLIRTGHESVRRHDEAVPLVRRVKDHEREADASRSLAMFYEQQGQLQLANIWRQEERQHQAWVAYLNGQVDAVLDGHFLPAQVDVDVRQWHRVNTDDGNLSFGPVESGRVSVLTGADVPPPADRTRPYGQPGGLRPPLALHQRDLERAMPREADGTIVRTADPRDGDWFALANDGGPAADATRSINCQDCVISLYETWMHGRPRVSAPRSFDSYAYGDVQRPLGGEVGGPRRAEDLTGGRYQTLLPDTTGWPTDYAEQSVDQAYGNLHHQLLAGGHGSMAFIINGWADGSSHAWAAINQNGTILYVDPQRGAVSANAPLYTNVSCMDAMLIGASGQPMPLPNHELGRWTGHPDEPLPSPLPNPPSPAPDLPLPQLQAMMAMTDEELYLNRVYLLEGPEPTPPPGSAPEMPSERAAATDPTGAPDPVGATPATGDAPPGEPGVDSAGVAPPGTQPAAGIPPADMLRDPSPAEWQGLGLGIDFADLGLDPESLSPDERQRFERTLPQAAMLPPEQIRFTQRSVSPQTSDRINLDDLAGQMRDSGWRGGPAHGVRWGDGSFASLDNRRLLAARRAGLSSVPFVVHAPSERLDAWPQEWSPERQQRNALRVDIVELADGSWAVGGDEGRVVYPKGTVPQTYGEIALFRAAEQRSLLPGRLFGADRPPVTLGKPPPPERQTQLDEHELRVLRDLRRHAVEAADQVQSDIVASAAAVSVELGLEQPIELRGTEYRIKSAESLARKYADEARIEALPIESFADDVNDVLRFSLCLPEGARYGPALRRSLYQLESQGYVVTPGSTKNFWRPGNRFFGVNCTLTAPNGQTFELQFPTDRSWRVGKATHGHYEVLRRRDELPPRQVHAFLQILATNKRLGLQYGVPDGLGDMGAPKNTTFAKWIAANNDIWRAYRAWLSDNELGFGSIAAEFGLEASDFPIDHDVAGRLEASDARLLRDISTGNVEPAYRDHSEGREPSRRDDLGPSSQGVGVRPEPGGSVHGQRAELGRRPPGGPAEGRGDHAGNHRGRGAPGRGDDPLDLPVEGRAATERRRLTPDSPTGGSAVHPSQPRSGTPDLSAADPGSDETGAVSPAGDHDASAETASRTLATLPRTELSAISPFQALGAGGLPVRRGPDGLIEAVEVDGRMMDIKSYVDYLMGQRVELVRQLALDTNSGISKRKYHPCISVAVDRLTGNVTDAHNNLAVTSERLHPLILKRLMAYVEECERQGIVHAWNTVYRHPSDPGGHSEIFAVNELLWRREAAGLKPDMSAFGQLRIDNYFPWMGGGKPARCCANCTALIPDVPCNAGKNTSFPPVEEERQDE